MWSWEAGAKWVVHVSAIPLCLIRCCSLILCASGNSEQCLLTAHGIPAERKSEDKTHLWTQSIEKCPNMRHRWKITKGYCTALLPLPSFPSQYAPCRRKVISLLTAGKHSYHKWRKQLKVQGKTAAVGQSKGPSVLVHSISDSSHTSQDTMGTWTYRSPPGHFSRLALIWAHIF